jgi:glycogen debranching enzyme
MDGLSILTYVNKWLGPLSQWPKYFAEASERGYNMIHYPPLQERGSSDSPYSIKNQLVYDPGMFEGVEKELKDGGRSKVEEMLKIAREEYGLLSLTDVVLNHTADNTPWLTDHPEAGTFISTARRVRY